MQIPRIPFKILAFAPFLPPDHKHDADKPIHVDSQNLNRVIEGLKPTFICALPPDLYPEENLEIQIRTMKDFHPDGLIQSNPVLRNIREAKNFLAEAKKKGMSPGDINARLAKWRNLPSIRIETETQRPASTSGDTVDNILSMVDVSDAPAGMPSPPPDAGLQIDLLLGKILRHIFSDPTFRTLESCWRGLKLLLQHANGDAAPTVEMVPVHLDTLEEAITGLTPDIIESMPSLILVDLPFDNSPRSLGLMAQIAQLAETLLVPSIIWLTPGFFHLDSWLKFKNLPFLPHFLEEPTYGKWQSLKKTGPARWLAVACNSFLTRYPYGRDNPPRLVQFEEQQPLWTSPVWALGCLIAQSHIKTGWPTRFSQWQDIRLENLPLNTQDPDQPMPVEILFTRDRMEQLIRSGMIPLAAALNKDIAFVPSAPMVGGTALSYQLFVSRITQFVLWCREHLPRDIAGVELEAALQQSLALFWQASGHIGPEQVNVTAGAPEAEGRIPLRIQLQPSPRILSPPESVELEFFW